MRRAWRSGVVVAGVALSGALLSAPSHATSTGFSEDQLFGVSVLSSTDAWAVGRHYHSSEATTTYVVHWDGNTWSEVESPNPGETTSQLMSVKAISPTDVWAVGQYVDASRAYALIEHWDGQSWSVVPSPTPPGGYVNAALHSVSAAAPNDVWAVGGTGPSSIDYQLIEHWNGHRWRLVSPAGPDGQLMGGSAMSSDDVWAVGKYPNTIEHWDGVSWTTGDAPSGLLNAVAGTSPSDVWAVGGSDTASTLTQHWDGQSWTVVKRAPGTHRNDRLNAVAAISPDDVWAVGGSSHLFRDGRVLGGTPRYRPLVEHWDGSRWTRTHLPTVTLLSQQPESVDGSQSDDVWVVGISESEISYGAWIEHWDGSRWTQYLP